ncbi:MAG TPA: DUF4124 domain-containing protein [Polaromonas sp.]|uniref:DUF4124 domain-containing protein n=1 Tax=Polaromonas sp. TaxID=1869339 RepID=UPI002D2D094A|nr:DUF4124 domain-containing protein [Polaromonas sp.]HYW57280.1 DUF4124 domain-containing protein [Polaromonas sp.]
MNLKTASKLLVLTLAGLTFALSAAAQWQWIGKDGRRVFSDRPPSSDIPQRDILKQPGGRPVAAAVAVEAAVAAALPASAASAAKVNAPRISGKDADLQAKKKKLEEEEAAKKKADEEKAAQSRAENCERVKKNLVTLQGGTRMSTTNAKGEREPMDDATRAAEIKRAEAIRDTECKVN